jgi:hypothetical protein
MRTAAATRAHAKRARAATHCKRGHSDWVWTPDGRRQCRVCKVDRNYYYRKGFGFPG